MGGGTGPEARDRSEPQIGGGRRRGRGGRAPFGSGASRVVARVPFSCSTSRRSKRNAEFCDLCYTARRKCALCATGATSVEVWPLLPSVSAHVQNMQNLTDKRSLWWV